MIKWFPSFIISIFCVAIVLRLGNFGYDLYDIKLYAKDTAPAQKLVKEEDSSPALEVIQGVAVKKSMSTETPDTVRDKLMKKSTYKSDKTQFSSKVALKTIDKTPDNICITGVMLKDAAKQLQYFAHREAEIKEQLALLETSDRRVREQIAKLKLIRSDIIESAKLADSKIQKESKHLISIYEKMKPKEAAKIFDEMASKVAANLLRTMKENQSSQILAKMNPKKAYDVTLSLAGGIEKTKKNYETIK